MTRLEANRKILEIINAEVEKHPDLRFCQLLWTLGIVENCKDYYAWEDNFYVESEETLKIVKRDL